MKGPTGKIIKCLVCGNSKYFPLSKLKRGGCKFCSNACKYENFRKFNKPRHGYKKCEYCSKEFYYPPHQQKKGKRFCSVSCSSKVLVTNLGNRMLGRKHSISTRKKMSLSSKSGTPETRRRMSLSKTGPNHPAWKGGLSPLAYQIRKSGRYIEWRTKIFQRDNYTCSTCGVSGGYLEVHHLKPFAEILHSSGIVTLIESWDYFPLWDLDNGVTLCRPCHDGTKMGRPIQRVLFRQRDEQRSPEVQSLSRTLSKYLKG